MYRPQGKPSETKAMGLCLEAEHMNGRRCSDRQRVNSSV